MHLPGNFLWNTLKQTENQWGNNIMKSIQCITAAVLIATTGITASTASRKATDKKNVKKKTVQKPKLPLLTMNEFIKIAVQNSPALGSLRYDYEDNISQAKRAQGIKDIMLTAKANLASSELVTSSGVPAGMQNLKAFNTELSLAKKFPGLLGLTTGLSITYNRSSFDRSPLTDVKNSTPVLNLQLAFPLLRNLLGEIDRNALKVSSLTIKLLKKAETEAIESFVQTLISAYIDWYLLSQKTAIYHGIMARAAELHGQTLRKRRIGLADWSDVHLVNANYLRYRSLYLSSKLQEEQQYINLIAMMKGKAPAKGISRKTAIRYRPQKLNLEIQLKKVNLDTIRTVRIAELTYKQSVLYYKNAISEQKPDLNLILSGGANARGSDARDAFSNFPRGQFYAGVEFSTFLQNRDKKNQTASRKAAKNKRAQDYRNARKEAAYTLTNLTGSIFSMIQLLKVSRQRVTVNNDRLGTMYRKYTQGRVALSQVTDARDGYANARISSLEQEASLKKLYLSYLALADELLKEFPVTLGHSKK